tara:strand:- start:5282 stop:7189 length:1908 start_codon:yes stop_codon:yes gene_type:complete
MTGIVPEPGRKFESVDEYYKYCLPFAGNFFSGRISEDLRDEAYVEIEFLLGDHRYSVRRGFFETEELLSLKIDQAVGRDWSSLSDYSELGPGRLHEEFISQLVADIGVASFEQFVFLQHFVLTFDEQRRLLFWDPKVLDQALFIAFGVDYEEAQRADTLQRDWEKSDSLARNAMWQATQVRRQLSAVKNARERVDEEDEQDADLVSRYETLRKSVDETKKRATKLRESLRDAELELTELTARQAVLRNDYADEYSKRIGKVSFLEAHPMVAASLQESRCNMCGNQSDEVEERFRSWLRSGTCPLCEAEIKKDKKRRGMKRLQELDRGLSTVRADLEKASTKSRRLVAEHETAQSRALATYEALEEFEAEYGDQISSGTEGRSEGDLALIVTQLESQIEEAINRKTRHRARRNEKGRELKKLRVKIQRQYGDAEEDFVPAFTDLAHAFLGLELSIALESKASGLSMVLQVKGTNRRHTHQLSESQRFFVDIALRMALVKYMSRGSDACLVVDTPEGSLDIAYESRAGEMMARFVDQGFSVLMTANINSSQLLRRLARRCGAARMSLQRMTSWTDLSEVQVEEEGLFEAAYEEIEEAMALGPADSKPSGAKSSEGKKVKRRGEGTKKRKKKKRGKEA